VTSETDFFETIRDIAGLSVIHSDFVVVSSDQSGRSRYEPLTSLLGRVRAVAGVEVLFVSQFLGDAPAVRHRARGPQSPLQPDPAEVEFGTMLLARSGTGGPARCIAASVVSDDGRDFGTVCCDPGGRPTKAGVDLAGVLRSTARILALALSRADAAPEECETWQKPSGTIDGKIPAVCP
jgi:hypothetical protein